MVDVPLTAYEIDRRPSVASADGYGVRLAISGQLPYFVRLFRER